MVRSFFKGFGAGASIPGNKVGARLRSSMPDFEPGRNLIQQGRGNREIAAAKSYESKERVNGDRREGWKGGRVEGWKDRRLECPAQAPRRSEPPRTRRAPRRRTMPGKMSVMHMLAFPVHPAAKWQFLIPRPGTVGRLPLRSIDPPYQSVLTPIRGAGGT